MSRKRLKPPKRENRTKFIRGDLGKILKAKSVRRQQLRRENIARESRHLLRLEKIYAKGLRHERTEQVLVRPNLIKAEGFAKRRKELVKLAETIDG